MRSFAETKLKWEETLQHGPSIANLQRAVKFNGPTSPCLAGCRSVCWRAFLLFRDAPFTQWSHILAESRGLYSSLCDQHMRFIKHPEQLAALSFDPLADDPDSPWESVRKDELVRAEILQDVRRLPDEPFYHQEAIQTMILDILFLYCKLNPSVGGYRQGMHELLAPIVLVVAQDAIDRALAPAEDGENVAMADTLDSRFIEHDAYALFSRVMGRASAFYEVGSDSPSLARDRNTIVEKSKYIHEVALMRVDQELATHLRNIEVLPQIFLIRWIRLLFGREFPFERLLAFWDTIFAFDPNLELIDLICVAMLLRIRWTRRSLHHPKRHARSKLIRKLVLEADYSVALQLLLKYPAPQPPHGPHTFVDDAIYLKDHQNAAGGVTLIFKYTGKSPSTTPTKASRASTPSFQGFGSLRQRTLGAKSPLSSTARLLLQQPGGVEALLQGATKGMIERGEKLGINQAVRDAVGEIRRNMQGLQETRTPSQGSRVSIGESRLTPSDHSLVATLMERRNRQLAAMLEGSITNLKQLVASGLEGEKEKQVEAVEFAASKIQFVKACLEDTSLALPEEEMPSLNALTISNHIEISSPTVALDTTPVVMTSSAVEETRSTLSSPEHEPRSAGLAPLPEEEDSQPQQAAEDTDMMDAYTPEPTAIPAPKITSDYTETSSSTTPTAPTVTPAPSTPNVRPNGPIPTRSSLAQSSFAWMLEPDTTLSSSAHSTPSFLPSSRPSSSGGAGVGHKKRQSNASRERNAFLFGEVVAADVTSERKLSADEIFGLQPIRKGS
ncbi:rab-GTPase-TBC domain-containing protein [Lasiosphaeris hirsuta]|uniref:Rab-GTPase-TBC domain-containing protein n=1 Tax=Lasiosphaeris hirsuta TaxID=260670 RepID=A0AA40A892_9PEZI|nr:rab-GTPase-TBC domain-containing protein [Lasiosphaeris hirsuta]